MATIINLSKKTLEKWRKEDIELHKRILTNELMFLGASLAIRNKFFILYDRYITPDNILGYIHKPAWLFIQCLVNNTLEDIYDIKAIPTLKKKRKRKKK